MNKTRRKWLIASGLGVVVVAGFVAVGLMEQGQARSRLERARLQAKSAGVPLTMEEYREAFRVPAESDNAWPLYVETIRRYRPTFGSTDPIERFTGPSDAEISLRPYWEDMAQWRRGTQFWRPRPEALAVLEEMNEVLEAARQIPERRGFHIDQRFRLGIAEDFQEAVYIADLANLLLFDALVASQQGAFDRSLADLEAAAGIADHFFQMPVWHLLERGINTASNVMAVSKWLVSSRTWPMERLESLQEAVKPALQTPDLKSVFRGVVFRGLLTIDTFSSADKMRESGLGRRATLRSAPRPAVREQTETEWLEEGVAILRDWPENDDLLAIKALFAAREERLADALRSYNRYVQTRTEAMRELEPVVEATQSHVARGRLIHAMFSSVLTIRQEGRPPSTLPLSGESALDPFTNKPLRYSADEGFRIWSVGSNGEDENGSNEREGRFPKDWVVRYPDSRTGW